MCNFKSFIVTKSGDVLCTHEESHESIIRAYADNYDLRDETADPDKLLFARVEIVPPGGDVFERDLSEWKLNIDQQIKPSWWSPDNEAACFSRLESYLSDVIIDGQEIDTIKNKYGLYIRNSKIGGIYGGTVNHIYGGTVNHIYGGTVNHIYGGTIGLISGGTVKRIDGGTVKRISGGTVKRISGGTVEYIYGGTVEYIYGGTIEYIYGGTIEYIYGGTVKRIDGGTVKRFF